jgi:multidrug efflux pump subunit AcrA (membrane-fusion protein)
MVAEYRAEIKKQEANVEATQYTVELSRSREQDLERQVDNCRILAPVDGMVVYANEVDRRGDASFVIEEGALIRDGQPIVRLPDPTRMQVRTKVNDSKINRLEAGDDCMIRVDTDPESPISGQVRQISTFPLPRRWYQAPIEYEVFVDITEPSELIRSGLRAKVEIFTERLADCLQAPLSSLIRHEDDYFVFVKGQRRVDPRKVEIGINNDRFVVITDGLEVGEEILVDADNHREQLNFAESTP